MVLQLHPWRGPTNRQQACMSGFMFSYLPDESAGLVFCTRHKICGRANLDEPNVPIPFIVLVIIKLVTDDTRICAGTLVTADFVMTHKDCTLMPVNK